MDAYDVVVIGSGTSGQTAAFKLNESGLKVAVVEKSDRPGGTCALAGCLPKKWFYEAAEAIAKSRHLEGKGIVAASKGNWSQVLEQKHKFTSSIPEGTIRNFEKAEIDLVAGTAVFLDEEVAAGLGAVGVVIEKVIPDTEAERAGLEGIDYRRRSLGDVIVAVEGSPVANMDDFARILQNFEIGQTITLEVRRGEALREVVVAIMDIC